jgi:acylphosphatase
MVSAIRARVVVTGVVQGVFFRESTRSQALQLGVCGWVRNLPDGRVEAALEGAPESVEAMVGWMRSGPDRAVVESLERVDESLEGCHGFDVRH